MPTTDDTHRYYCTKINESDVIVIVPSELSWTNIKEIEDYFALIIKNLDGGL